MATLIKKDLRDALKITHTALDCKHTDELRREVLPFIRRSFNCDKTTFFLADNSRNRIDYKGVVTEGIDTSYLKQYIHYYHILDPHLDTRSICGPLLLTQKVISFRSFMRTQYYNDFLMPQRIHYHLGMILKDRNGLLGMVTCLRPRNMKSFSAREMLKAKLITPYLTDILKKCISTEKLRRQVEDLKSHATNLPNRGPFKPDDTHQPWERSFSLPEVLYELGISRREWDVVSLVNKGYRNAQIAEELFISIYTVENHLRSIFSKTGVKNRTALIHRLQEICASKGWTLI